MPGRDLHLTVHADPGQTLLDRVVDCRGQTVHGVQLPSEWLTRPLTVSFEDAWQRLDGLARCFIEPDGSFLWTSESSRPRWQVDGQLHDAAVGLMTAELKVSWESDHDAVRSALQRLFVDVFSDGDAALILQLVRTGVYLRIDQLSAVMACRGNS